MEGGRKKEKNGRRKEEKGEKNEGKKGRQLYGEGTGLAVVEVGEWAGSGNGMRRG